LGKGKRKEGEAIFVKGPPEKDVECIYTAKYRCPVKESPLKETGLGKKPAGWRYFDEFLGEKIVGVEKTLVPRGNKETVEQEKRSPRRTQKGVPGG